MISTYRKGFSVVYNKCFETNVKIKGAVTQFGASMRVSFKCANCGAEEFVGVEVIPYDMPPKEKEPEATCCGGVPVVKGRCPICGDKF